MNSCHPHSGMKISSKWLAIILVVTSHTRLDHRVWATRCLIRCRSNYNQLQTNFIISHLLTSITSLKYNIYNHFRVICELKKAQYHPKIELGSNWKVFKIFQVGVTTSRAWFCDIEDSSQTPQSEDQIVMFTK